jgi:hypothetical protein
MNMKQIKELLANADVHQIIEEQIQAAIAESKAELDTEKTKLVEQKKSFEKEAFIFKKTILAKSNLYETKLKDFYEAKFNEAKKKLGKEVYEFMNESVKKITKAIEEDVKATNTSTKIQEAFSKAVSEMAPFININELEGKNQADLDSMKNKLNESLKKIKVLEAKALIGDLHSLVVSECSGYPTEKIALLYETVTKMEPKNLEEGKKCLEAAKQALKEREVEATQKPEVVVTESVVDKPVEVTPQRNKLKVIAENLATKKQEKEVVTESKESSALDYEIYLG